MNAQFQPERMPEGIEALRVPPHDIAAEQSVLGALMMDPRSLAKISDWLVEGDFYRKDHRLIYRAIVGLIGRGDPVDAVTLGDWLDSNGMADMVGGMSYLAQLQNDTPSSANIVAYAELIVERSRLRTLIDEGCKITEAAYNRRADSQQIVGEAVHQLTQMQASKMRGGLEPAKVAIKKLHVQILERYNRGAGLIGEPWPWKELNDRTNGLRDGTLYIVGARPSMGKSVFGLQTAVFNALRGHRTAFFSVEMGAEECMGRAVACTGEIPHSWVEQPTDEQEDADVYWGRLTETIAKLKDSPLIIDETPALSGQQMFARASRAHLQSPLRLIVVDHMHDMKIDPKNARFDYGEITQLGKTMAKQFGCPVILLAQLNRESAKGSGRKPGLADLRESGEIEQKGDVILFLHREDYYNPQNMPGAVEVIPAKGRNMRVGGKPIYLQNRFDCMRLDDWIGPDPVMPEVRAEKKERGMR